MSILVSKIVFSSSLHKIEKVKGIETFAELKLDNVSDLSKGDIVYIGKKSDDLIMDIKTGKLYSKKYYLTKFKVTDLDEASGTIEASEVFHDSVVMPDVLSLSYGVLSLFYYVVPGFWVGGLVYDLLSISMPWYPRRPRAGYYLSKSESEFLPLPKRLLIEMDAGISTNGDGIVNIRYSRYRIIQFFNGLGVTKSPHRLDVYGINSFRRYKLLNWVWLTTNFKWGYGHYWYRIDGSLLRNKFGKYAGYNNNFNGQYKMDNSGFVLGVDAKIYLRIINKFGLLIGLSSAYYLASPAVDIYDEKGELQTKDMSWKEFYIKNLVGTVSLGIGYFY